MSPDGSRSKPLEQRVRAAGDVDRAGRARLVHRHDGVAVAVDPAAVAERLVERLAEHDARVLDRVVRAGLQVAGDLARRGPAGRGGRAGRACGRRSRRPVARVPAPVPERPSVSETSVSPVLRLIVAVRVTGEDSDARAPSTRRGRRSPRPRRSARRRRASAGAASCDPDLGHAAPEVADVEAGGEARGALGRQRVVRARDVVAERGAGCVADEQAAGGADARRERLGRVARQLQVLGRERLGEGQRGLHVVGEHLAASPRAPSRMRLVVADRDRQRALAVLGLGGQVERSAPRRRRRRRRSRSGRDGPAKPSIPTTPRHLPLGLLDPEAARADDHVDRGIDSVP